MAVSLPPFDAHELDSLHSRIDAMFEDFFGGGPDHWQWPAGESHGEWSPAVDVYETASGLIVRVELPGMEREAIEVQLEDDVLTISGERQRGKRAGEALRVAECPHGAFRRSFALGIPIEPNGVSATYANGVLEVRVPRAEPSRPRRLAVRATTDR